MPTSYMVGVPLAGTLRRYTLHLLPYMVGVPLAGTLELGRDILPLPDKISTNTLHTLAYRF
jgi:hypothetical protein